MKSPVLVGRVRASPGQDRRPRRRCRGAAGGRWRGRAWAMRTLVPGYPAVMAALAQRRGRTGGGPVRRPGAGSSPAGRAGIDLLGSTRRICSTGGGNPYVGADGRDWPDNPLRFAALAWAAADIGAAARAGRGPDIVHAHDWQAGWPRPICTMPGAPAGHRSLPCTTSPSRAAPARAAGPLGLPPRGSRSTASSTTAASAS